MQASWLDAFPWPGSFATILYFPRTNTLVPLSADAQGQWPPRHDDNVLAIHLSAMEDVAKRLCGME